MAKADLHVHTKFSDHPSEWLWQRFGVAESYTEPEAIYHTAKAQGMDFVTITDHDQITGALQLHAAHPDDTILGVESTAFFPDDGCAVHVLSWGFSEAQFAEIQRLRLNLYALRDYLLTQRITHALAHATFAVNNRLTVEHLEELILLFDVFEGINGGRNRLNNDGWSHILRHLAPEHITDLQRRHDLMPASATPWLKGLTGGSDDHGGTFAGATYTVGDGATPAEFLEAVANRATHAEGRHNDYRSLAFTLYKVAFDYAQHREGGKVGPVLRELSQAIWGRHHASLKDQLRVKALKSITRKEKRIDRTCLELIEDLQSKHQAPLEDKLDLVYDKTAALVDEFVAGILSAEKLLKKGRLTRLIKDAVALTPGMLLAIPFLSTLKLLHKTRPLLETLQERLGVTAAVPRRVLWFTDTLNDLNGVSVTLKKIGWMAFRKGMNLQLVTSLADGQINDELPPNIINLPSVHEFALPGYETYQLRVPSLLRAIAQLAQMPPDEIIISTPGPVGLLGVLASYLFSVKSAGIYHTDFTAQTQEILGDETSTRLVEGYMRWFYTLLDEVRPPTREYIRILADRGVDPARMRLFHRGIDTTAFQPHSEGRAFLRRSFNLPEGINLLYVGRVSKDKGLDFLVGVYETLLREHPNLNLIVTGDGPHLPELRRSLARFPHVILTGKLPNGELPQVYSGADLFMFPSTTDTFGMAVLEAQACGVPAIVSDVGGPQEIIADGETGWVARANDAAEWVHKVNQVLRALKHDRPRYEAMRAASRARVLEHYDWENILPGLLGEPQGVETASGLLLPAMQEVA